MSDNKVFQPLLIGNAKFGGGDITRTRFDMPCKRTATVQNVLVDLWDGPTGQYVFPATPIQMQVVSASASDAAAGTGARTVVIEYLDDKYNPQVTTVILNGVTAVNTVPTNILRVQAFHVQTVGSGGVAAGAISLQAVGGAVTYDIIKATQNRSHNPVFTIPAGKTGYVTQWQCSSASAAASIVEIQLLATCHNGVATPGVFLMQDQAVGQYIIENVTLSIPLQLPEKTDIKLSAISGGAADNATAAANVVGWYE